MFMSNEISKKGFVELHMFMYMLIFYPISGAHFNPAITIGNMIMSNLDPIEGIVYIII